MRGRHVQIRAPGVLWIEQRSIVPRHVIGTDVSGPACVYARVRVRRGAISYFHGDRRIDAPRTFDLFLPPFAIVQALLERCDVKSTAWVCRPVTTEPLPAHPVLLPADDERMAAPIEAPSRLRGLATAIDVGRAPDAGALAAEAKAIIDNEYGTSLRIGSIAARCRVAPAVLSRRFQDAYGVPPVRYRHQVRIVDALTQLAAGVVPVEVFQAVGFNDLSRFYKVFRKLACASPGAFRPAPSNPSMPSS